MKKRSAVKTLISCLAFFPLIAVVITVAVMLYGYLDGATGGNRKVIAAAMFGIIVALSLLCTLLDYLRRRMTVDKTVDAILEATERIASGDFSYRLQPTHSISKSTQFDFIIENLNKMAEELSRTEVLHTDFISNFSHEIKTPLAVIQNYATSLQNGKLDEQTRMKYADTISSAAKRLTTLVTNILKLNKLENQGLEDKSEQINLTEYLTEIVLGFEDLFEQKQLELDCDFDENVFIVSSPSYLEIVWNNLISNAIKFTEAGGKISIGLKNNGDTVTVTVSDTGCGISQETGKHIFEKFYQGDTSHSTEGNGLGLALVKRVIDTVGGKISVESELGRGTTFSVTLYKEVGSK